jgi:hypothetical protein
VATGTLRKSHRGRSEHGKCSSSSAALAMARAGLRQIQKSPSAGKNSMCANLDITERLLVAGKLLGKCLAGYRDNDLRSAGSSAADLAELIFDAVDEIDRLRSLQAAVPIEPV